MPKKQSLTGFLQDSLEAHKAGFQRSLSEVEQAQIFLSSRRKLTFRVKVTSLWADQGERPVHLEEKGSLKNMLAKATEQFKELNKRSDVQARYEVSVVFPNSYVVQLLPEVWERFQE
jgi:hypothetical protein